jgi:hypothetical protein
MLLFPLTFLYVFVIILLVSISCLQCTKNYGYEFYQIVTKNHQEYLLKQSAVGSIFLPQIHLMRIPKAASTSLSTLARSVVGCEPPGPCCKWPGDPIGSCPNHRLFDCQIERKVIGCTGHDPQYSSLQSSKIPSITIIREPIARSVSAFFYPNHHNMECFSASSSSLSSSSLYSSTALSSFPSSLSSSSLLSNLSSSSNASNSLLHHCFQKYLTDNRYSNILVKMFTGSLPYSPLKPCQKKGECRHSLEVAVENLRFFQFIGITEMWELSLFLFYHIFPQISPSLDEFTLFSGLVNDNSSFSSSSSSSNASASLSDPASLSSSSLLSEGSRVNKDSNYSEFKKIAVNQYSKDLSLQNQYDVELYQICFQWFCKKLHELHLVNTTSFSLIEDYWRRTQAQLKGFSVSLSTCKIAVEN